ncbi:glycosyltransferase family 52 [Geofilum sp. OHC36d9]|uniref:glycosyltransferase family 52 n=1 Tax=Geofilum sp. OHC36d9 TaxID=3458413 RepID=UPI0040344964
MRRESEQHGVFINNSPYSLLIYVLLNKNWRFDDYVFTDRMPLVIQKRLKTLGLRVFSQKNVGGRKNGFLGKMLYRLSIYFEFPRFLFFIAGRNYSSAAGNDELVFALPFLKKGMTLIEDGTINYQGRSFFERRRKKDFLYFPIRVFYGKNYLPFGFSPLIKKIILTGLQRVDPEIERKVQLIDLAVLWQQKSDEEKKEILFLFGMKTDFLSQLQNYPVLLITQHLPIPEKDKVAIYDRLLDGVDNKKVLIKTHYAESTDYHQYFQDSTVFCEPIPLQLFDILGYRPQKVVTISSTAALHYKEMGVEVVFAGSSIDPRIEKVAGKIG